MPDSWLDKHPALRQWFDSLDEVPEPDECPSGHGIPIQSLQLTPEQMAALPTLDPSADASDMAYAVGYASSLFTQDPTHVEIEAEDLEGNRYELRAPSSPEEAYARSNSAHVSSAELRMVDHTGRLHVVPLRNASVTIIRPFTDPFAEDPSCPGQPGNMP